MTTPTQEYHYRTTEQEHFNNNTDRRGVKLDGDVQTENCGVDTASYLDHDMKGMLGGRRESLIEQLTAWLLTVCVGVRVGVSHLCGHQHRRVGQLVVSVHPEGEQRDDSDGHDGDQRVHQRGQQRGPRRHRFVRRYGNTQRDRAWQEVTGGLWEVGENQNETLPSGKRLWSIRTKTSRHKNTVFPCAVNKAWAPTDTPPQHSMLY